MATIRLQAGARGLEIEGDRDVMVVVAEALNRGDITLWSLRPDARCDDKMTKKAYRPGAPDWYHDLADTFEEFLVEDVVAE